MAKRLVIKTPITGDSNNNYSIELPNTWREDKTIALQDEITYEYLASLSKQVGFAVFPIEAVIVGANTDYEFEYTASDIQSWCSESASYLRMDKYCIFCLPLSEVLEENPDADWQNWNIWAYDVDYSNSYALDIDYGFIQLDDDNNVQYLLGIGKLQNDFIDHPVKLIIAFGADEK